MFYYKSNHFPTELNIEPRLSKLASKFNVLHEPMTKLNFDFFEKNINLSRFDVNNDYITKQAANFSLINPASY